MDRIGFRPVHADVWKSSTRACASGAPCSTPQATFVRFMRACRPCARACQARTAVWPAARVSCKAQDSACYPPFITFTRNQGMGTSAPRFFGAVEAGGTKFGWEIGDQDGRILIEERFPTTDPDATIAQLIACLRRQSGEIGPLSAIGLGSFGPIELRRDAKNYGSILKTPKAGWSGTDLAGALARAFSCPIGFDTDVNAAALSEHRWGAARDVDNLVYLT